MRAERCTFRGGVIGICPRRGAAWTDCTFERAGLVITGPETFTRCKFAGIADAGEHATKVWGASGVRFEWCEWDGTDRGIVTQGDCSDLAADACTFRDITRVSNGCEVILFEGPTRRVTVRGARVYNCNGPAVLFFGPVEDVTIDDLYAAGGGMGIQCGEGWLPTPMTNVLLRAVELNAAGPIDLAGEELPLPDGSWQRAVPACENLRIEYCRVSSPAPTWGNRFDEIPPHYRHPYRHERCVGAFRVPAEAALHECHGYNLPEGWPEINRVGRAAA